MQTCVKKKQSTHNHRNHTIKKGADLSPPYILCIYKLHYISNGCGHMRTTFGNVPTT